MCQNKMTIPPSAVGAGVARRHKTNCFRASEPRPTNKMTVLSTFRHNPFFEYRKLFPRIIILMEAYWVLLANMDFDRWVSSQWNRRLT